MTGYTPNVGDHVTVSRGIFVKSIVDGWCRATDGTSYPLYGGWSVELIKAAPVPFEVGKPLTEEMGEPPVGSVIRVTTTGNVFLRKQDGWHSASPRPHSYEWWEFRKPDKYILLHLGSGK